MHEGFKENSCQIKCFSLLLGFSSKFVNTATQQNSFPMLLKFLIAPVLLCVVSLSLKRFILVWVHGSLGGVRDDNDPPGHGSNGYQVLDNAVRSAQCALTNCSVYCVLVFFLGAVVAES